MLYILPRTRRRLDSSCGNLSITQASRQAGGSKHGPRRLDLSLAIKMYHFPPTRLCKRAHERKGPSQRNVSYCKHHNLFLESRIDNASASMASLAGAGLNNVFCRWTPPAFYCAEREEKCDM